MDKRTALAVVRERPFTIKFMDQTVELCEEAIKRDSSAIEFVKEQTDEMCFFALEQYEKELRRLKTPARYLDFIDHLDYGSPIQYIKEQREEICLAAVRINGLSLRYILKQTPEICLAAVRKNGDALLYVKEQTPEICAAAVQSSPRARAYVESGMSAPVPGI